MPNCPFCGGLIIWVGTAGGKRMPLDAKMKTLREPMAGWVKEGPKGLIPVPAFREVQGYTSHLSTCPQKDRFSSRDERKKPAGG